MAAIVDPAFRVIPKNSTFFFVWRIEKMQVVSIPKDQYGSFYTGDSYIVTCATEGREKGNAQMKFRELKGQPEVHIHFWLGKKSSQDESTVAAYKTVELDDHLGGFPIQHREVQGWESKKFISYFPKGIRLLEGGVASGLNHVTHSTEPVMYHIKGKRRPVVRQVPVSWSEMNDGDVFVLNAHEAIFIWVGRFANNMEKLQAAKVAQQLKAEQGHSMLVIVDDGREQSLPSSERQLLDSLLPFSTRSVKDHREMVPDEVQERKQTKAMTLYKCSDEGGTLKVTEVKCGPFDQRDLKSQDSFIVDNGVAGIWVWVGRRANKIERTEAMKNAQGFIKEKGYPNRTPVTRVVEGGEPAEFKTLFLSWTDANQTQGLGKAHAFGKIAKTVQTKFDASTLHSCPQLAAETQMVDDGKGAKQVYHVVNYDLRLVEEEDHGVFYSGDSYVIVYAYNDGSKDNYIIYYWLGLHSTVDEKGTAAIKTVELDDKLNGEAVQVRVVQGKEPPHFMAIFAGKIIIFQGGVDRDSKVGTSFKGPSERYLLQVRGTNEYNTKAFQVELSASSLNSNDVFTLYTLMTVYIWAGKGSTGDEREMGKRIAAKSGRESLLISEGQEKHDFWEAIGGHAPYSSDKVLQESNSCAMVRLFQCSNASGKFLVEEIPDFDQNDLVEDDVMLLDAWDSLFLWIGEKSNKDERNQALEAAQEYLSTDPSGRDINTSVITVKQGHEPPNFTGFFGVWEKDFFKSQRGFEALRVELAEENPGLLLQNSSGTDLSPSSRNYGLGKYQPELLIGKDIDELPADVDPSRKETYLTDDDFEALFGMSPTAFEELPKWRQKEMKKKVGLF